MKKHFQGKLSLNKTTVVSLESKEMNHMQGGGITRDYTCFDTDCGLTCTCPPYCE